MLRALPRVLASTARPTGVRALSTSSDGGLLAKVGLDDWKRQLPLGIFLGIPLIQNEVLILSEETQLVGCFALFCGTVYNLGADSIAEMLDAKGKSIMAQHNALEEEAILSIKEVVSAHESRVALLSELQVIAEAQAEGLAMLKSAKCMELEHAVRADMVKKLDTLVQKQEATENMLKGKLIAEAAAAVEKQLATDESVKTALLAESIKTIGNPKNAEGGDVVTGLFKDFFAKRAADAKANKGKQVPLSDAAIAELNEELAALAKRDGIAVSVKVDPTVSV